MATYKVIQDIEAEDHILGPLSLRQFIFGLGAALCFYLSYIVYSKGASFLLILFLPPGLFAAFFAIPFGRDQPTEIWALAKIRYYFKPRKRIWDQSGVKDLVTITVPKKIEVRRSDGLSQTEVRSRLNALANTIDSRGWAVKNVDLNLYTRPGLLPIDSESDRLIDTGSIPQAVPTYDISAADDILDEQSNPIARQFDDMINASTQAHHQQLVDMLQHSEPTLPAPVSKSQPADNTWFMQQASPQVPQVATNQTVAPGPTQATPPVADDAATTSQLRAQSQAQDVVYEHMKTIQPIGQQTAQPMTSAPVTPTPAPTPAPVAQNADTAQLATNNDLNISTLARVANKQDLPPEEEVIIPLH